MTQDLANLFAAIRDKPPDDLLRELYAEALEQYDQEHPATAECPSIRPDGPCDAVCVCRGTGTVPDTRLADRVEFVRVGIELERAVSPAYRNIITTHGLSEGVSIECQTAFRLRSRHDALLARHRLEWLGGAKCTGPCRGAGLLPMPKVINGSKWCPDCHGTGWACWPLVATEMTHGGPFWVPVASHFSRGWVSKIELTWAQLFAPGVAAAIWRHHPVEDVVITDAVIHPSGGITCYVSNIDIRLPSKYWWRMNSHRTYVAACKALSEVACEWGREQAQA